MLKLSARPAIRLRGVRHNNLKNFDLDLPLNQLIVITGLSGSGKSSLAFDTLFAEGQRRYIETFSPYARQFFDRMDKPQVDSVEGIPPAIAIEQRNTVKTTRSTVGTLTEICDYMRMLWPHVAELHCRQCGQPVRKEAPQQIWQEYSMGQEVLITFDLPLTEKLSLAESLALVSKQGYTRLLVNEQVMRIEEAETPLARNAARDRRLTVVQDRLRLSSANRPRFVEACEQAYHFGKGKLTIWEVHPPSTLRNPRPFSSRLHCARCDLEYREASPALFSFNHPVGACPKCRGFGRIISIDYKLALPDRSKTLEQGVVKPWQSGMSAECQTDLRRICRHFGIPMNIPFDKLPRKWRDLVIQGDPDYGKDEEHEWPRAWYGVKGYFRWLESRAYKMHVRVLLSRYRAYSPCPDCHGARFQPETLLYKVSQTSDKPVLLTLADFYRLPIRAALQFIETMAASRHWRASEPLGLIVNEVRSRLTYLIEVGLGYLTLDRPTRSLSGGETERVSLTTCLGTRLVNTLYVLDEPSVGLHPRDTARLVRILEQLRDAGNTVVVVEHEASVIRAADQIVDLGPGHGATGGQLVYQGTYQQILKAQGSLTGQYLSGRKQIEVPPRRPVGPMSQGPRYSWPTGQPDTALMLNEAAESSRNWQDAVPAKRGVRQDACPRLRLAHATKHNLKDLAVEIPLGRFVCVTGVSGSGKTTLVREVLLPALTANLRPESPEHRQPDRPAPENGEEDDSTQPAPGSEDNAVDAEVLSGSEHLGRVVLVDQSILSKTPRSNPAVYIGAFDEIREFFAQSDLARQRGLNASAFSFNSSQGQCERCRGAGFEKIEMQFLSDVFIRCPDCNGRRYRSHILQVKISPSSKVQAPESKSQGLSSVRNAEYAARNTEEVPRARELATRASRSGSRVTLEATRLRSRVSRSLSIADLLESTIEEAIDFLAGFPDSRPAQRALSSLRLLEEVGLGYLALGQPINTLSGGESQRLKLVRHLAEAATFEPAQPKPTLFLFDEPTTGLHFDDVRVLLQVFHRLVDAGHSVLVIEHNLELIKCADWIIDLGPDAGDEGGQIVAEGTPEQVAACPQSHTGDALRELIESRNPATQRVAKG
jgi:excinuclease ABC subunit A